MSEPVFREVTPADWDAIWPIVREVVGTGETFAYPADMTREVGYAVWMPDPAIGRRTFVAESDGQIVARPTCGRCIPVRGITSPPPGGWSVRTTRVTASGGPLRSSSWTRRDAPGFTAMQFNAVVATNRRAIALWKSLGFQIIGTIPEAFRHVEHGPTGLHVMHREL